MAKLIGWVATLAVCMVGWAAPAQAEPSFDDGLKTVVCQMFDAGYSTGQIAREMKSAFAETERRFEQHPDWPAYVRQAASEQCPQYA